MGQLLFVITRLCCNFQPCDAADAQEPRAQEEERSPQELLLGDSGTSQAQRTLSFPPVGLWGGKGAFMISLWPTAKLEDVLLEISRTESEVEEEEEEECSTASDPFESADFPDLLDQSEGSDDVLGSFIDLKLEEGQPEACALLTGQADFEEEPSSPEAEEEGEALEEKPQTEPTPPEEEA